MTHYNNYLQLTGRGGPSGLSAVSNTCSMLSSMNFSRSANDILESKIITFTSMHSRQLFHLNTDFNYYGGLFSKNLFIGIETMAFRNILVLAVNICQMNLDPRESRRSQGLLVAKQQQTTCQVVAKVWQIRRDHVCTAAEVHVMGQVECHIPELYK